MVSNLFLVLILGFFLSAAPRSELALKHSINVGAGVIGAGYRGPVGVILFNPLAFKAATVSSAEKATAFVFLSDAFSVPLARP
ncbi:hypothetical protein AHAS_Ahas19G0378600 [Arachis hypogaea]